MSAAIRSGLQEWFDDLTTSILHFCFPHVCEGCQRSIHSTNEFLCFNCLRSLPATGFELLPDNAVEKLFWGRLDIKSASARFYFTKQSPVQRLLHLLKYRGMRDVGLYMGRLMGEGLKSADRFNDVDTIIPMPLHETRQKARGYNQAEMLCRGIAEVLEIPVHPSAIVRRSATETQTKKGRLDRWSNIEGRFEVKDEGVVRNRHVLLVDDVVTTGATLEACGAELMKVGGLRLSVAALCISTH